MPVLRPYGERNAHLGTAPGRNVNQMENFDFRFCDVAKYIISELQNNEEILRFRNGRPSALYKHAVGCKKCNGATIHNADRISDPAIKDGYIKIELKILAQFGKWIKRYYPESNESNALFLLMEYYDYAYFTMRPEWIAYKQRYGDLKK